MKKTTAALAAVVEVIQIVIPRTLNTINFYSSHVTSPFFTVAFAN